MDDAKKLKLLEEIMELDEGTLAPETVLAEEEMWDSMSQLSFIAMMDDEFGKSVSGEEIQKFKTVQDLLDVMIS